MTSAGSRIGKIASNKLLIAAVFAVGIIAALFYSVPAYAFTIANGEAANVNGTTTITYNATIYKVTDEAIGNVSAKLWQASTMGSTPGKDYVYATSCTPSYYATTDGYSSTGYSPNGYGFTEGGNIGFGYTGDAPSGYGYFYGTGYGYGYTADADAPMYCIFEFKNLDYGVPYTNVTVYINDIAVNTLATDTIVIADYVTIFGNVVTALNAQNITTNLADCAATANACTNLWFNKTINNALGGKITFTKAGGLDLTDQATVQFLQSFEQKMNAAQGMVQLNASNSATFNASGINASIVLWGLPNYGAAVPSLTVTYDNGTISTSPTEVSGLAYNGTAGTLTFLASHLSKYQTNVPYVANTSTVTITETTSQVVINPGTPAFTVSVPSNATSAVLNVSTNLTSNASMSQSTINVSVVATSTSALLAGTVNVTFPANVTIYGPTDWNGQINLPIVKETSTATFAASSGYTTTTYAVIDLGIDTAQLNFSKAVRIVLPGMAGKYAAFKRGSTITNISGTCSGDTQTDGDGLAAASECRINSGSDLVVWTKHFTQFFAYYQNTSTSSSTTYTYTTVTPTPSAAPTVTASTTPTSTPTVSTTPLASPTPGQEVTTTSQPTVTASIVPTVPGTTTGATGGDNTLIIIVIVVVIIGAGAYFFTRK